MHPLKLAIADDQVLFLKGLRLLMQSFPDIELIIEATDGEQLWQAVQAQQPDVILLDLRMPKMDGLEITEKIKATYSDIKIIALTMYNEERLINHMMKAGVNGYLLKNEEPAVLHEAIRSVVEKGFYFNDYVSQALLKGLHKKNSAIRPWKIQDNLELSKRELEVLNLLCKEYTSAEIAEKLFISTRTVENHRKSLLSKTGVRNTAGLIIYAIQHQVVDLKDM